MYVSSRVNPTSSAVAPSRNTSAIGATRGDAPAPAGTADASPHLSGPARLLNKLSQLRDSAPQQLSEVVSGVAADLRNVAAHDSGMSATMLTALASRLDGIASGGGISPKQPAAPPGAEASLSDPAAGRSAAADGQAPAGARAAAARAYRASEHAASPGADAARAAITKMLDDLAAAVDATSSAADR